MKILVIKFRNIGDVLLSTPLISNLKFYYPDSDIDFALNKGCEDMVSDNSYINNVIVYDRPRIKKMGIFSQFKEEIKFTRSIRNNNYDMVINLTEGDRGAQLALLSGAKVKIGFPIRKGILSKIDIFDKIADDEKWQHTVEKDLQFIKLLNKEIRSKEVAIFWSKEVERKVEETIKENHISDFVHIHPVSRWMFKCWEDERMARIIDYLYEEKRLNVVITGAPIRKELDRIEKILSLCKTKPVNLSGKLSLKQLACLSSKAKLFFGVDTAPMHMAAATNTPVLTLFGASFPVKWGPWNNNENRKSFTDSDAIQSNGKHKLISNMRHEIYYDDGVKKSRGMTLIDYETVKSAIDSML